MAWLRFIGFIASAVAFVLAAPSSVRAELEEEISEQTLRSLDGLSPASFERYRGVVDPLGQLDPYLTVRNQRVWYRTERTAPWRALEAQPEPASVEPRNPIPFEAVGTLEGLRIAIDPGHRGGAWSREEKRHVTVGPGPAVREGDLTWAVAVQLETMLESRGAEVRLTRDPPPHRAFPAARFDGFRPEREAAQWANELRHAESFAPFARWLETPIGRWALPWVVRALPEIAPFRVYNRYELRRRSQIAAEFEPHVTLSLHFNVSRDPLSNGIIVFLLGNFVRHELATASQRYYALRALTSGVLERARPLAVTLGRAMQEELGLGPLSEPSEHPLGIAKKIPVVPEDGVFARNLALLRRTPGVVLLVEGPCMNAVGEFERLQASDVALPGGGRASHRTTEYARAVVRALATHRDALLAGATGDATVSARRLPATEP